MIQTNLALKLDKFEGDYCYPYLIDDSDKTPPDNIIQFPSLTSPDGKATNYSYDEVSNLTNMSLPNNTQVNYQFDSLNRLLNLTNKKNIGDVISSFGYNYNLAGMRNKVTLADGSYIEYEYDNLNRLTKEEKYDAQGNLIYSSTYEFDPVGNRLTKEEMRVIIPEEGTADFDPNTLNINSSGNFVTVYLTPMLSASDKAWITEINENSIHPIKAEKIEADSVKFNRRSVAEISKDYVGQKVTYTVIWTKGDKVYQAKTDDIRIIEKGKPSKKPVPPPTTDLPPSLVTNITTTYTYNEENQLLSANDVSYAYDDNGNLISKSDDQGATDYTWDYENRLVGISYPDGTSDEYVYDGVGKRIQTNEDGVVTNYLYDGLNCIIETDGTTTSYVRGLGYGGGIGSIISANGSYYYYDGIGNVANTANGSGDVTQEFVYDAYGNVLNSAIPSPHGFSTKEYSSRSGLIHFGVRLYDPTVGRFISKDPLEMINGPNVYNYCMSNPVNLIDPWGLYAEGTGYQQPTPLAELVKPVVPSPSDAFWGGFKSSLEDQLEWATHPFSTGVGKSPMAQAKALGKGYYRAEQLLVGGGSAILVGTGVAKFAALPLATKAAAFLTVVYLRAGELPPLSQAEIWRMIGNQVRTAITLIIKK